MKRLLIFIFLSCTLILSSQNVDEIKQQITSIQSQPDIYYFGYAEGKQRKETDQKALQELMSKIYVVVSSEVTSTTSETGSGNVSENLDKVLSTYTYGRLPDVEQLYYKTGPIFHILRYIKKSEYKKIFENKKTEIRGFLREAEENLFLNQLGKAFRNYYRAAVAIEGLQEGSLQYKDKVYSPEIIFNLIREIGEDIRIKLVSNEYKYETRTIVLDISYNKKPVNDLNIYYYDLHDFIPHKTNYNLLQIDLWGKEYKNMETLTVKIDMKENLYNSYLNEIKILSELFECEQLEIYKEIKLKKKKIKSPLRRGKERSKRGFNITFNNPANCPLEKQIAENTFFLFTSLDNELIDDRIIFSDESIITRMDKVIDNNHTKLLVYPQTVDINKTDFGWEVRQFGVSVSCEGFPTRNETVVVDFDENGKIYNFCYTINPALHELFETQGTAAGDWDYRQIAIKFLENYKTSYTTKNIEDIETLYSEDAIIIIGKVITRTKLNRDIRSDFSEKEIIYFKRTKKEHIQKQKEVFARNKFVWLQFDTFNINCAPIEKIYGVSMKQNYFSSTYKDEGYLFLLTDFRGEKPLIHVRNWQPGEWDLAKQMKLENFRFY
ncbi:MAG: LPP20 family lipoprotein [Candidatus Cloacimonetes bacterium]|nr:LPP20 family lipoprotein [Candidatus Cloacimonadota bacterium]